MAQHYSDPQRENDPHVLPDLEVFYFDPATVTPIVVALAHCERCGSEVTELSDGPHGDRTICTACAAEDTPAGWYYWVCFPGCLPDGDPTGPFETEAEALADARDGLSGEEGCP
jgi:hypothetical protein